MALLNLEAQFEARYSSSFVDRFLMEGRRMDKVMAKFDDEYKRRMAEEDMHSINNYESLNTLVKKLYLEMVALKDRKDGSVASTAVVFLGKERWWWVSVRTTYGNGVWREIDDMDTYQTGIERLGERGLG